MNEDATELLLIRHGETDWNRAHRFQGQLDVPLNDTGREQAERLAARLHDEPIDLLICSDLARVMGTAAPLARQRRLTTRPDAAWREQSFGAVEGLAVRELPQSHPELWERWVRHEADFAFPHGESVRRFHQRVMGAVQALAERHVGQRVVVVTHGGVLDMIWRSAQRLSLDGPRGCAIPNAGINRLRCDVLGQLEIVSWADADHLAGLPDQPSTVPASVAAGLARPERKSIEVS